MIDTPQCLAGALYRPGLRELNGKEAGVGGAPRLPWVSGFTSYFLAKP